MAILAADTGGVPVSSVAPPPRVALVVGNEGAGVSSETRARADRTIGLPLSPQAESLNVAVATGILLYLLSR